jgi:hypothetical protein
MNLSDRGAMRESSQFSSLAIRILAARARWSQFGNLKTGTPNIPAQ